MLVYVPTYIHNQSQVIVLFQSGAGIEVLENQGQMAARLYLPLSFMVRQGTTISDVITDNCSSLISGDKCHVLQVCCRNTVRVLALRYFIIELIIGTVDLCCRCAILRKRDRHFHTLRSISEPDEGSVRKLVQRPGGRLCAARRHAGLCGRPER